MDKEKYVVVIGAANIDIGGTAYKELIPADSNQGIITISFGGVGRNIAYNLAKLGVNVVFITALGDDTLGKDLLNHCKDSGINTDYVRIISDSSSSMYIYINNCHGDMELAMSHVEIVKNITPEYLDSVKDILNGSQAVMTDCNITQESFNHLKEICTVPLYVDPVSVSHADKIKYNLSGIDTIKPNKLEAEYLTDILIETEEDYKKAALVLIDQGVNNVFISMGDRGMLAAQGEKVYIVERYPADVISTTGAGDAATAAIIWAFTSLKDKDIITEARAANATASLTIESYQTTHPELSESTIIKRLSNFNNKVKEL